MKQILFCTIMSAGLLTSCNISAIEIDRGLIIARSGMTDAEKTCLITIINRLKSGDVRTDDLEIEVFKKQSYEKEVKTGTDAYNHVLARGLTPLAVVGLKYVHEHVPSADNFKSVKSGFEDWENMLDGVETFLSSCRDARLVGDFVQFIAEMGGIVDRFHNVLIYSQSHDDKEVAAKQFEQDVREKGNRFTSYLNEKATDPQCIDQEARAKFYRMAVALQELWIHGYRDYFGRAAVTRI